MENLKEQYKKAIDCNNCFNNLDIQRGKVKAAQPRWIGENYFDAKQRICILMINPGDVGPKAEYSQIKSSNEFQSLIEGFKDDIVSWEDLMFFILRELVS